MKNRIFIFISFLICTIIFSAKAEILTKETDKVRINILSDYTIDENFQILAKLELLNGWHIYGPEKQDFGVPTKIELLPAEPFLETPSFSISEKFVYDDVITQYGYNKIAYIYTNFTPQKDILYTLRISWMACKDFCEEEHLDFKLNTQNFYKTPNWNNEFISATKTFASSNNDYNIKTSCFIIIILAFLAGITLNFMPCIFPILSIKTIYMLKNHNMQKHNYYNAFMYVLGVLLCFLFMATCLFYFRKTGEAIGWGFQLQSPYFVASMIFIFTIIFLMFLDVIRIPQFNIAKYTKMNSFLTGLFAVIIASPCSGPFMGMIMGYAFLQSIYLYYPIFISLALGYALPFAMIDIFPHTIAKILPKSGKWLIYLKRILSIPVLLTIIWLFWVLFAQINLVNREITQWQTYSSEKLQNAIENHQPVFINFTAKWCLTCLLNDKSTLSSKAFNKIINKHNVLLLKADWTNKDKNIFKALQMYDRNSIPLYVYYNSDGNYTILPQILTPNIIRKIIK